MSVATDIGLRVSRCTAWCDRVATHLRPGARQGVVSIADQAVASATTFLTGALVGRFCAKEEFGLYTIGFGVVTLAMTLQSSLVSTPYMIRVPRLQGESARRFSGSSLVHQMALAAFFAAITLAVAVFTQSVNQPLSQMLFAVSAMLVFLLMRDYVRQCCFARLAYTRALGLDIVLAVLQVGGLAILYATNRLSASHAILVLGAACALTALHWFISTHSDRAYSAKSVVDDFAQTWLFGKWLVASGIVWAISMNLYAWIVAGFHGTAMAGTWAAALGVMTLINPVMLGIQNVIGPRIMHAFAGGGAPALRIAVRDSAISFCAALLAFSAVMLFAGGSLVELIYGAKYAGTGMLVFLLSLNAATLTVGFAVSRGLFALELARVDFYINCIALACFLICGIALVRFAGPVGAALAQLATNVLATSARGIAFSRYSHAARHVLS